MGIMLKSLSHSKLEQLRSCPLSAYFDHVAHEPREPELIDYALPGKVTHEVIEDSLGSFVAIQNIDEINPIIQAHLSERIDMLLDDELTKVERCLNHFADFMRRRYNYVNSLGMLPCFAPTATERTYESKLNNILFRGIVDAEFNDRKFWMIDWKTSSNTTITSTEVRQAHRYALLYYLTTGNRLDTFHVVNLNKPVDLNKCAVKITDSGLEEQRQEIAQAWETFHGDYFPKNKTYESCLFCAHKLKCVQYSDDGVKLR